MDRHYALAREAILAALTAYTGITTADGATPANNTLICADLIGKNDFITNKTILIGSGDAKFEDSGASSFVPGTGTITVVSPFSHQIKKGTIFRVLNISTVEIDVSRIDTKIGTNVDAPGTTTLFARLRQIVDTYLADGTIGLSALKTLIEAGDVDVAAIETKLDSPAQGLAAIMATLAAIDAKLVDPATGLAAIMVTLGSISSKLNDPATGLAAISATLSSISGKLDDPASGLGALAASIAAVLSKLDNPANGLGAIMATLAAHWNLFVDPAVGFTALANSIGAAITDIAAAEVKLDRLAGWEVKDTHAHANNTNWQEVLVITTTTRKLIKNIWLDFVNLTQNMEYRLSYKIDETNYRVFDSNAASPWTPAADDGVLIYCDFIISSDLKLELKSAVLETAVRDIPYEVDGEDME